MSLLGKTSQPDEKSALENERPETGQPLVSVKLRRILMAAIVLSFMAAIASTGWEIIKLTESKISGSTDNFAATGGNKGIRPLPPVHPVEFLPKSLKGYTVFGKQRIRGEEDYAAEAIFKPDDEQYTLVAPLNVYVRIVYCGSDGDAKKAIDLSMAHKNVTDYIDVDVVGIATDAGYTEDRGTLVIAWVNNGYMVELDASYTQVIPKEEIDSLEKNAVVVAKEIWLGMSGNR